MSMCSGWHDGLSIRRSVVRGYIGLFIAALFPSARKFGLPCLYSSGYKMGTGDIMLGVTLLCRD